MERFPREGSFEAKVLYMVPTVVALQYFCRTIDVLRGADFSAPLERLLSEVERMPPEWQEAMMSLEDTMGQITLPCGENWLMSVPHHGGSVLGHLRAKARNFEGWSEDNLHGHLKELEWRQAIVRECLEAIDATLLERARELVEQACPNLPHDLFPPRLYRADARKETSRGKAEP